MKDTFPVFKIFLPLLYIHVCTCNTSRTQMTPQSWNHLNDLWNRTPTLKDRHHSLLLRHPKQRRPGSILFASLRCNMDSHRARSLMVDSGTATSDARGPGSGSLVLSEGNNIVKTSEIPLSLCNTKLHRHYLFNKSDLQAQSN